MLGPRDPIVVGQRVRTGGIDMEAEVAVITDDVPRAESAAKTARDHIKLVMLVNDVSLRNADSRPSSPRASDFSTAKPATAFSPVAVTPDELGRGVARRQTPACRCSASSITAGPSRPAPMPAPIWQFGFDQLIVHAARIRPRARRRNAIVGSGTVIQPPGRCDRRGPRERRLGSFLHRRDSHLIEKIETGERKQRQCVQPPATGCASRCWMSKRGLSSGPSTRSSRAPDPTRPTAPTEE